MAYTAVFYQRTWLTSPFRRRRVQNGQEARPPASATRPRVGRGLPLLWPWAADANRSKLSDITLAHVLSGDTVSPISCVSIFFNDHVRFISSVDIRFPEFEAFLAFCVSFFIFRVFMLDREECLFLFSVPSPPLIGTCLLRCL